MYIGQHVCSYTQYDDVIHHERGGGAIRRYLGSIPDLPTLYDSEPCCSAVPRRWELAIGVSMAYICHTFITSKLGFGR